MKNMKIDSLLTTLLLFVAGAFMYSCSPDSEIENVSPETMTQNTLEAVCGTCTDATIYKTVSKANDPIGNVAVCRVNDILTVTLTMSDPDYNFKKAQCGFYLQAPSKLNPNPNYFVDKEAEQIGNSMVFTFTMEELLEKGVITNPQVTSTFFIAVNAVVPKIGGQVWAGNLKTTFSNKNSRYFSYTLPICSTENPPSSLCLFSQGFFFAKPDGEQWPGTTGSDGIFFGGQNYTYDEANLIFFGRNNKTGKTAAKQAFLQGLALKLNIERLTAEQIATLNGNDGCPGIIQKLEMIEYYFRQLAKVTATNINQPQFNLDEFDYNDETKTNADLMQAASFISSCIGAESNHCDNTPTLN
jgi:hypothetical protein